MNSIDIIYTCFAFFIVGILIITVCLFFCRIKCYARKKRRNFGSPAKFVPKVDLTYVKPKESVDKATAVNDFSKK